MDGKVIQPENPPTNGTPARLVITDDHDLARAGLRTMLSREPNLEVVGEASNGREALALCRRARPDLLLMDVRMPELDGLAACSLVKQECPSTSVIMVTAHENPEYMFEALKAGASGYILKDATQPELTNAVRKVLDGESPLNRDLATQLLKRLASEDRKRAEPLPESLTPRELDVLKFLARGQTNPEIAQSLVVSMGTVKTHVQHIIAKLGVSDRTQAAVRAIELSLLPDYSSTDDLLPPSAR